MFVEFYYMLRDMKIPVSITEFLSLMQAISMDLVQSTMEFYHISRSLLVKDEKYLDSFDQAFMFYFKDATVPEKIRDEIFDWLKKPEKSIRDFIKLSPEERQLLENYNWQELRQLFEARMKEQDEMHDGGSHWIGTMGKSRFGWGGHNPNGLRVGGPGGHGMAVQVAQKRLFRNYRSDLVLDTRQIQMALRKLRKLGKIGAPDELNLDATIRETCRLGGEIEFVWEKRKKNNLKLLLLMDVGGSMDPFAHMVSQIFSAANKMRHFKEFKHYYFHNCIYKELYKDMELDIKIPTAEVIKKLDSDFRVVIVGDAAMAPYELLMRYGAIDYFQLNETPGVAWLRKLKMHFPKTVWLNPEVPGPWLSESRKIISKIFDMFQLTLDGLDKAVSFLL
jgi:uncharacterized protein